MHMRVKLNRANALLFQMRKYVSLKILRSIYFAIFDSYLSYCCLFLTPTYPTAAYCSTIQRIITLQKKLLELLIFHQEISIPVPYSNKTPFQNFMIKFALKIFYLSANL